MFIFNRDSDTELVIIAELGVNHNGSIAWIIDMLPKIKESGADAVKLQLFTPDLYISKNLVERHNRVKQLFISREDFIKIKNYGDSMNLPVFATPVSHDWIDFLADNCGVLKIASGDFTFMPTIKKSLESNTKLIISTGSSTREDVINFVQYAQTIRSENKYSESIALMHCISSYPPPLIESNLGAINDLRKISKLTVGFSSHFLEDEPLYVALGLGARIFEIHVTDDRKRNDIRDHQLSRTPEELKSISNKLRVLNNSYKLSKKYIQPSEIDSYFAIRKGIVFSRPLEAGHIVNFQDLTFARPLNPDIQTVDVVIGKKLKRSVEAFTTVYLADFES